MTTILGLSGSLRRGSHNSMLLAAAAAMMPEGTTLEIASIRGIPLFDADDYEQHGIPPIVSELKERIAGAGGLLLATPEYNNSIPGVAKNAVDWLSRPLTDVRRVFGGLPVALIGATSGRGGTILAQAAWLPVLRALETRPWFGRTLTLSGAAALFDAEGLRDEDTRVRLDRLVKEFAAFAAANRR
jgi:chromate reductase, NAD(P)H dehydrogenase (quinone)